MNRSIVLALALSLGACKKNGATEPVTEPTLTPTEEAPTATSGTEGAATGASTDPYEGMKPEKVVRRRLDDAAALLTTRRDDHARKALKDLAELEALAPEHAEIAYNKGVAHEILGEVSGARKEYLRATEIDPTLAQAWMNMGALSEEAGEYERALLNYEAGLRHSPDDPNLVVGVIGVLRRMGKYDQAIERAKKALTQNANNINAYNNLGLVYLDQGQVDMALFIYKRAEGFIDGADRNAMIHCNLGRVYLAQDKPLLAQLELEKALKLDPTLVPAKMYLGRIRLDNRDWAGAVELLEAARDQEPENPSIRTDLGIGYRGLGRYEEAQRSYEKALELAPQDQDPRLNLAVLLGDHMKSYDAALEQIARYRAEGGTRLDLASTWELALQEDRDKYERALDAKKRREEARKKREERERLAKEAEARAVKEAAAAEKAAAADKAAAEKAAKDQASKDEAAPGGTGAAGEGGSQGAAPSGSAAPAGDAAPAGSAAPPAVAEPAGSPAGAAAPQTGMVWGTAGAAAAPAAPSCSGVGSCAEAGQECSQAGVCIQAGFPGAFPAGSTCSDTVECASGLACVDQKCTDSAASQDPSAGSNPWGG